jgi:hypothetical protein
MPRLLLFAACEKVIIDQQTNVLSLMSLLQDINVQIPPGAPLPPSNAIIPMQWTTVSIFLPESEDSGKQFEQRVTLVSSSNVQLLQSPAAPFALTGPHRIISQVNGMPIGNAGLLTLKCHLREQGANVWQEIGDGYPINVKWLSSPSTIVH